ncbi:MAG: hypothetical protein ABIH76_00040 [Candidatus Bathyarchaeota archaeon]
MIKEQSESFAESFAQIIEKLAGKESDLEIVFKDLAVEAAGLRSTLNGKISFNVKYYTKEKA